MAISYDVLNYIIGASCAKEAMENSDPRVSEGSTGCLISTRGQLQTLLENKFDSLSELFCNYDVTVRELDRISAKMSSAGKIHSLLLAIPGRYNHHLPISLQEANRRDQTHVFRSGDGYGRGAEEGKRGPFGATKRSAENLIANAF